MEQRLDSIDTRLGSVENRLGTLEQQGTALNQRLGSLETKVEQGFAAVDQKLDGLTEIVSGTVAGIEDHEQRIKMLEEHAGVRGSE